MDPGVKVAAALSVLVTAVCLAFLFWSDPGGVAAPNNQPLELRIESESAMTPLAPSRKPDIFFPLLAPSSNVARAPTILAPDKPEPRAPLCGSDGVPATPPKRPAANAEDETSWGTAAGVRMPELHRPLEADENAAPRTHTVVDGDTLGSLASRYLGAADRYLHIYQWNSDVLANPDVLPIGQILRIPPRTPSQPANLQVIERPLVPITEP